MPKLKYALLNALIVASFVVLNYFTLDKFITVLANSGVDVVQDGKFFYVKEYFTLWFGVSLLTIIPYAIWYFIARKFSNDNRVATALLYALYVICCVYSTRVNYSGFRNAVLDAYNFSIILNAVLFATVSVFYFKYVHAIDKIFVTFNLKIKEHILEIINRLCKAAEYRDTDTGEHVTRISEMCVRIGKQMQLKKAELEALKYGSMMHDVGKVGIPDNILLKPGKLTDEEFAFMKKHSEIGADLLKDSSSKFINNAEDIARYHHEKWNGYGYPQGLSGTDIPLFARIVAVVDVFDALVSERPYKKPWTYEDAIKEIESLSGKHFDPNIVQAFLNVQGDLIRIHEIGVKYEYQKV